MDPQGQAPLTRFSRRRRLLAGVLAAAALAALVVLAAGQPGGAPRASAQAAAKPNVIVLLTDDQENGSMRVMKTVFKEMKRKGVTMKHYYDNFPLCCPARSTILTGQFAHNHEVLSNQFPDGGYGVFNELHGDNYLPIWLQSAGYRTSYVGKYLNEYAEPDEYGTLPKDVPLGWDNWRVLAPSNAQYFGYTLNENGKLRDYGEAEEDYSTDVFTKKAKRFVRDSSAAGSPFYLELGYAAPHGGGGGSPGRSCNRAAVPAPRDLGTLKKKDKGGLSPAFNEADVSDKPSPVAGLPPLSTGQTRDTLRKRRCAWESLLGVDRSVGKLFKELERDGIRQNTYVFFLSDNGYLRGEHRIRNNKRYLYEESARIPLVVTGPGVAQDVQSDDVVNNADLTATITQIAGATPGLTLDGESMVPALTTPGLERGRATLLEAYAGDPILGVRTSRYLYTEWDTGKAEPERELYDMYLDPYQLQNRISDPAYAGPASQLKSELQQLIDCSGANCHPEPTGQLSISSQGNGKAGCQFSPVVARAELTSLEDVQSVDFFVGKKVVATDTGVPFETALPDKALRKALPKRADVIAKANYIDGRRLALPARIKICK